MKQFLAYFNIKLFTLILLSLEYPNSAYSK